MRACGLKNKLTGPDFDAAVRAKSTRTKRRNARFTGS
jgi:hypothetical protein